MTFQMMTFQIMNNERSKCQNMKDEYEKLVQEEKILDEVIDKLNANKNDTEDKKVYMNLLHKYNDIKDAAQIAIGALANIEGLGIKEIHERFSLPTTKD